MEGRHRSTKSSDKLGNTIRREVFPFAMRTGSRALAGGGRGGYGRRVEAGVSRTEDERLRGLPDFPFESSYEEVDGLRLAYLDEGDGPPVVFFHGEATWSFLLRKVIPPVRDAGYRCIAPDYAGFGRSDKPTDVGFYTYDRHIELMNELLGRLELSGAAAGGHARGGA